MFTDLDANNCCSIIAQDLLNSVVNSANKESIAHIRVMISKEVLPYSEAFLCSSQFNFLLPRLSLPWKHNQNARQPVPMSLIIFLNFVF